MKDALQFAEKHQLSYNVKLGPINGWRTVVKMAVRGVVRKDKRGRDVVSTAIGLFKPGSHNVASCTQSTAHHPVINQALQLIDEIRKDVGLNGYIEGTGHSCDDDHDETAKLAIAHNCYLKYVLLVLARASRTVQLSLVWNTEPAGDAQGEAVLQKFLARLRDRAGGDGSALFHSVWVNYNPSSRYSNAITGRGEDSWRLVLGERYVSEVVKTDMRSPPKLLFPPFVFRQANICAFTNIICNVRHWIKDMLSSRQQKETHSETSKKRKLSAPSLQSPGLKCVELYAGVGTIGLNCLDLLAELNCSDENPHNLACFEAARAAIEPEELRARAAYRPQAAGTVALSGGLRDFDLVLVDPPRKGLDDEVVAALLEYQENDISSSSSKHSRGTQLGCGADRQAQDAASCSRNNERLIYVSCGFPAFKRDAARLLGQTPLPAVTDSSQQQVRHWRLVHLEGHILFPGSDHIETLAVFDRLEN